MTMPTAPANPMSTLMQKCLSFDDVLLVPKKSDILSRNDINIGIRVKKQTFKLPIISSPMDTVTEHAMAVAMANAGGLGIIHRYNTIKDQCAMIHELEGIPVGAAIGVTGDYMTRARSLWNAGCKILCVDVAHGHHVLVEKAIKSLKDTFDSQVMIIAGNVATAEGFEDLQDWGANAIRVGIGGGSICSTRIQTGHGVSTFQSIASCKFVKRHAMLIADGGIRTSGDIVKSIGAGADFVMLGSMLAGTDESPGETLNNKQGDKYKVYRGMASTEAQVDWRGDARSLEGISTTVPYKGPVKNILDSLERNIRSGFSYSGARNQLELRERCMFIQQSTSSKVESNTHILLNV